MTRAVSRPGLSRTELSVKTDSARSVVCAQQGGVAVVGIKNLLGKPNYTVLIELGKGMSITGNKHEKTSRGVARGEKSSLGVRQGTATSFVLGGNSEEIEDMLERIEMAPEKARRNQGASEDSEIVLFGTPSLLKELVGTAFTVRIITVVRSVMRQAIQALENIREEDKQTREVSIEDLDGYRNVCCNRPDITAKVE